MAEQERTARIIVKGVAEVVFTYTHDAHDGRYSLIGDKSAEVLELLNSAEKQEQYVQSPVPMWIFNPKSYSWVLGILQGHYGYRDVTVVNMPEREHFSDFDPSDTGLDEDGNQIIY